MENAATGEGAERREEEEEEEEQEEGERGGGTEQGREVGCGALGSLSGTEDPWARGATGQAKPAGRSRRWTVSQGELRQCFSGRARSKEQQLARGGRLLTVLLQSFDSSRRGGALQSRASGTGRRGQGAEWVSWRQSPRI